MIMNTEELFALQHDYLMKTYVPDRLLVRGEGTKVWDSEGTEFLDFTSGISVCNLGHCHPAVTRAIQAQAAQLVHVSNLFANEMQPQLAKVLSEGTFGGRVFFCNSGAEANEGVIKFARKWGSSQGRHEIICMHGSFHGRTLGTLAATDRPAYRKGFGPGVEGFHFVDFNDLLALDDAIGDQTAAVLLEPIQGEGGVRPADPDFIKGARELCDKHGVLLIFDEVQCGVGRTGSLFACHHYDVTPDAMSMAKALGNGFPIGAFAVQRQWEDVLTPGTHATTFGGTPLACSAALAVLEAMDDAFLGEVRQKAETFTDGLQAIADKYDAVKSVRGVGLLIGMVMEDTAAPLVKGAGEKGLLILSAGADVVRFLPPLTVSDAEIEQALGIVDAVLGELS
jgi:predicted acetylornithine/succinylornithine family transaminase